MEQPFSGLPMTMFDAEVLVVPMTGGQSAEVNVKISRFPGGYPDLSNTLQDYHETLQRIEINVQQVMWLSCLLSSERDLATSFAKYLEISDQG